MGVTSSVRAAPDADGPPIDPCAQLFPALFVARGAAPPTLRRAPRGDALARMAAAAGFTASVFRRGQKHELFGDQDGEVTVEEELRLKLSELHRVWKMERTGYAPGTTRGRGVRGAGEALERGAGGGGGKVGDASRRPEASVAGPWLDRPRVRRVD